VLGEPGIHLSGTKGAKSHNREETTDSQSARGTGQSAKGKITEGIAFHGAFGHLNMQTFIDPLAKQFWPTTHD